MAEHHEMTLTWTGPPVIANQLARLAEAHSCEISTTESDDVVVLTVIVADEDLQRLRDTVDALLVSFDAVESDDS